MALSSDQNVDVCTTMYLGAKENIENEDEADLKNSECKDIISNIEFKVVWNKQIFQVVFDENKKIEDLKEHIKDLTGKRRLSNHFYRIFPCFIQIFLDLLVMVVTL